MGDKGKSRKAKSTKVSKADKAARKRVMVDSIRSGKGTKKEINRSKKKRPGRHNKNSKKGD